MMYYGVGWTLNLLMAPVLVAGVVFTALGVGTFLAALNVAYRDFRYVVPLLSAILDVRYAGGLSGNSRAGAMAMGPLSQSDGRRDRGLSIGLPGPAVRFPECSSRSRSRSCCSLPASPISRRSSAGSPTSYEDTLSNYAIRAEASRRNIQFALRSPTALCGRTWSVP